MSNVEWFTLLEVNDRLEAEIIKEALEAQGIQAEIFQEGVAHFGYPVTVGRMSTVQVCVPNFQTAEANAWLENYQSGNLDTVEDEQAENEREEGEEEYRDSDNA